MELKQYLKRIWKFLRNSLNKTDRFMLTFIFLILVISGAYLVFQNKPDLASKQTDSLCSLFGCKTYNSDLGFSFQYPDYMYVTNVVDSNRIAILPNSHKTNKDEPLTAVIISAGENPQETPFEWMLGGTSSYDISQGYEKVTIDGEKAIAVENGTWIVVNTPDNKWRLSIALMADKDNGKPLYDEQTIIINTLKFIR